MSMYDIQDIASMPPLEWGKLPSDSNDTSEVELWSQRTLCAMLLDIAAEARRLVDYCEKYGADNQFSMSQWELFHEFCGVFYALPNMDDGSKLEMKLAEWEICRAMTSNNCPEAFSSIRQYWNQYLEQANTCDF